MCTKRPVRNTTLAPRNHDGPNTPSAHSAASLPPGAERKAERIGSGNVRSGGPTEREKNLPKKKKISKRGVYPSTIFSFFPFLFFFHYAYLWAVGEEKRRFSFCDHGITGAVGKGGERLFTPLFRGKSIWRAYRLRSRRNHGRYGAAALGTGAPAEASSLSISGDRIPATISMMPEDGCDRT